MAGEVNIVAIVKGEERYVFMFDDESRSSTLRKLGQFASNPELSFSWYDAAVLSQKIRKTQRSGASTSQSHDVEPQAFDRHGSPIFKEEIEPFPDFDFDFQMPDDQWIGDDPF